VQHIMTARNRPNAPPACSKRLARSRALTCSLAAELPLPHRDCLLPVRQGAASTAHGPACVHPRATAYRRAALFTDARVGRHEGQGEVCREHPSAVPRHADEVLAATKQTNKQTNH
jgi:hypothetical protein